MSEAVSVLFVCLGNICRSTMAEGIFQSIAKEAKYQGKIGTIDSCGTGTSICDLIVISFRALFWAAKAPTRCRGTMQLDFQWMWMYADGVLLMRAAAYHTGDSPDSRTLSTLEDNGITDYDHAARRVRLCLFLFFSPSLSSGTDRDISLRFPLCPSHHADGDS